MEAAAFRLKSQEACTRINRCQHAILTLREGESKGMRHEAWGMEGESGCWWHLKLPWESCATASYLHRYWPPLSLAIACVSLCLQASQSGSVTLCWFSSWLLPSSFHHPFLSCSVFYPTFPLLSHSSSYFLLFSLSPSLSSSPLHLFLSGLSGSLLCWTSHSFLVLSSTSSISSCSLVPDNLLPPSRSCLTH